MLTVAVASEARRLKGAPAGGRPTLGLPVAAEPTSLRAIIVDDDPADIALIDRSLRRMARYEAQVTTVSSLDLARRLLATDSADVVLVDYNLDGECGLDLIREFSEAKSSSPFILVTSLWSAEIEGELLQAGGVACLSKDDINARVMETTIRQALRGQALEGMLSSVITGIVDDTARLRLCRVEPESAIEKDSASGALLDLVVVVLEAVELWRSRAADRTANAFVDLMLPDQPVYVEADEGVVQFVHEWISDVISEAQSGQVIGVVIWENDAFGEVVLTHDGDDVQRLQSTSGEQDLDFQTMAVARSEFALGGLGGRITKEIMPSMGRRTVVALPLAKTLRGTVE